LAHPKFLGWLRYYLRRACGHRANTLVALIAIKAKLNSLTKFTVGKLGKQLFRHFKSNDVAGSNCLTDTSL